MSLTATLTWLYFKQTNDDALSQLTVSQHNKSSLIEANQQLLAEQKQLLAQLDNQQHDLAIQKEIDQQLQQQLNQLQNTIVELNKELMFYQNITQGTSSTKLQIRDLTLSSDTQNPDNITYRIVITQGQKITKPISGTILITMNSADDNTTEINKHELALRHVQVVEGIIDLTNNKQPDSVTISLKRNKKKTISQTFDWLVTNK